MDGGKFAAIVGGALMLYPVVRILWKLIDVRWRWTVLSGTILRTEKRDLKGEDGPMGVFYPVIRVRLSDGETMRFASEHNARTDPWMPGDVVRVCVRGDLVQHLDPWLMLSDYAAWAIVGLAVTLMGVLPPD